MIQSKRNYPGGRRNSPRNSDHHTFLQMCSCSSHYCHLHLKASAYMSRRCRGSSRLSLHQPTGSSFPRLTTRQVDLRAQSNRPKRHSRYFVATQPRYSPLSPERSPHTPLRCSSRLAREQYLPLPWRLSSTFDSSPQCGNPQRANASAVVAHVGHPWKLTTVVDAPKHAHVPCGQAHVV